MTKWRVDIVALFNGRRIAPRSNLKSVTSTSMSKFTEILMGRVSLALCETPVKGMAKPKSVLSQPGLEECGSLAAAAASSINTRKRKRTSFGKERRRVHAVSQSVSVSRYPVQIKG